MFLPVSAFHMCILLSLPELYRKRPSGDQHREVTGSSCAVTDVGAPPLALTFSVVTRTRTRTRTTAHAHAHAHAHAAISALRRDLMHSAHDGPRAY